MSENGTDRSVYSDLEVGDHVRWHSHYPRRGRCECEGEVIETDLECNGPADWAFRIYRVKTETGWSRVSAAEIEEVLQS